MSSGPVEGFDGRVEVGGISLRGVAEHLRMLAMDCIATWAGVELDRDGMVVAVCNTNRAIVARSLFGERAVSRRRATLKVLGNAALKGEIRQVFFDVLEELSAAEGNRNTLAHSIWGYCNSLPDCVLLVDPSAQRNFDLFCAELDDQQERAIAALEAGQPVPAEPTRAAHGPRLSRDQITVHTRESLEAIREHTRAAGIAANTFSFWQRAELQGKSRQRTLEALAKARALRPKTLPRVV